MKAKAFDKEFFYSGHGCCPGCGMPVALKNVFQALGKQTIVVTTAGCFGTISGVLPVSPLKLATYNTAFASTGAAVSGVRATLDMKGDTETTVLAISGDGGCFDIGIQSLSGAAERNEDIIYLCYDNEAYMNTGIQRSSATPWGAWTTTTPPLSLKNQPKKDIMQIMAAHRVPYIATASIAYMDDLIRKIKKAKATRGFKFIHIVSPCPVGWRFSPELTIRIARLAVQTHLFPLYEVEDGERYILSEEPVQIPVEEYLKLQGRFDYLKKEDIAQIQEYTDRQWRRLMRQVEGSG
jgi:pyruvate/2-oxoacid:ferredoxin oxidoreductase beta subunit